MNEYRFLVPLATRINERSLYLEELARWWTAQLIEHPGVNRRIVANLGGQLHWKSSLVYAHCFVAPAYRTPGYELRVIKPAQGFFRKRLSAADTYLCLFMQGA